MSDKEKDIFDPENEATVGDTVAWNKVGDFIAGTYIGVKKNVETKHGLKSIFQILARRGAWTQKDKLDGKETTVEAVEGEVYGVWGKDDILSSSLGALKIGQNVGVKFTESKPSTKGNAAKIVKVYADGTVNSEWLEQQDPTDGEV